MHICFVALFITGFYIACLLASLDTIYFPKILMSVFLVYIPSSYAFLISYSDSSSKYLEAFLFCHF